MKVQGDEIMRKDYQTLCNITLGQKKEYLTKVCQDQVLLELIYECMSQRQFDQIVNNSTIHQKLFIYALKGLYQTGNYEEMEYHLMMMNSLFHNQDYQDIKNQLFCKLCKKTITINEYCVLRHLVDFNNLSFEKFVKTLFVKYGVEAQECAKICLLEDQYHLACLYLKELPECPDESILDLLCSYSVYEYVSLMRYYAKKKKGYQLAPTH